MTRKTMIVLILLGSLTISGCSTVSPSQSNVASVTDDSQLNSADSINSSPIDELKWSKSQVEEYLNKYFLIADEPSINSYVDQIYDEQSLYEWQSWIVQIAKEEFPAIKNLISMEVTVSDVMKGYEEIYAEVWGYPVSAISYQDREYISNLLYLDALPDASTYRNWVMNEPGWIDSPAGKQWASQQRQKQNDMVNGVLCEFGFVENCLKINK